MRAAGCACSRGSAGELAAAAATAAASLEAAGVERAAQEATAPDLSLLCTALRAAGPPADASFVTVARLLRAVCPFPATAAAAAAALLSGGLRGAARGSGLDRTPFDRTVEREAARTLTPLLGECASALSHAEAVPLAEALLEALSTEAAAPAAAGAAAADGAEAAVTAAAEEAAELLGALGNLCPRLGSPFITREGCQPLPIALRALAAAAAALRARAGPPAADPGAPPPPPPAASGARHHLAALRCAALACSALAAAEEVTGGPARVPAALAAELLGQVRRFLLFGRTPARAAFERCPESSSEASDADGGRGSVARWRAVADVPPDPSAARVRAAACTLFCALCHAAPRCVHPHWPALLCPRPGGGGGGGAGAAAALPRAMATDASGRVRAAAAGALATALEGGGARAYMHVAEAVTPRNAASLSGQLAAAALAVHGALITSLAGERNPEALHAVCRAACAYARAVPFARLPQPLLPQLLAAAVARWRREGAAAGRAALLSAVGAALATAPAAVAMVRALSCGGECASLWVQLAGECVTSGTPENALAALRCACKAFPAAAAEGPWADCVAPALACVISRPAAPGGGVTAVTAATAAAVEAMRCGKDFLEVTTGWDGEGGRNARPTVTHALHPAVTAAAWAAAERALLPAARAHGEPAVRALYHAAASSLACPALLLQPSCAASAAAAMDAALTELCHAHRGRDASAAAAAAARSIGSMLSSGELLLQVSRLHMRAVPPETPLTQLASALAAAMAPPAPPAVAAAATMALANMAAALPCHSADANGAAAAAAAACAAAAARPGGTDRLKAQAARGCAGLLRRCVEQQSADLRYNTPTWAAHAAHALLHALRGAEEFPRAALSAAAGMIPLAALQPDIAAPALRAVLASPAPRAGAGGEKLRALCADALALCGQEHSR